MSNWEKNQKKRDRLSRQRQKLREELEYYRKYKFAPEDQEFVDQRIRILERDLDQNSTPNTYR